jgi:hypothetical protein
VACRVIIQGSFPEGLSKPTQTSIRIGEQRSKESSFRLEFRANVITEGTGQETRLTYTQEVHGSVISGLIGSPGWDVVRVSPALPGNPCEKKLEPRPPRPSRLLQPITLSYDIS